MLGIVGKTTVQKYIYRRKNANQRNLINKAIESFDIGPREAHVW